MCKRISVILSAAATLATAAIASAVSIEYLPNTLITDLSGDGSVAVGNLPVSFETFRWTQGTGVVALGRGTVGALNIGGGSPDVSRDGKSVSATILSDSGTYGTIGRWTTTGGWQQLIPPGPPDSVISDASNGSAWGMSGDGSTVVGLYQRTGPGGSAHASRSTTAGTTDLGSTGTSRANAASYDGSVIGGWEQPSFSQRRPILWINGVKTPLATTTVVDCQVSAVNADGAIVAGSLYDPDIATRTAALWTQTGGTYNYQNLGVLPGTVPNNGSATPDDISADGSIVVGFNRYSNQFSNDGTGFYWSAATGMISADQLFANLGLTVPSGLQLLELTTVSPDGKTIGGIGLDLTGGTGYQSFIISVPEPTGLGLLLLLALPVVVRRRK